MIKVSEVFEEMEGRVMARGLVDELEKLGFNLTRLGPMAKQLMRPGPRRLMKGTRGKLTLTPGVASTSPRGRIRQALQAQGVKTSAVSKTSAAKVARRALLRRAIKAAW